MGDTTSDLLVPAFFVTMLLGTGLLAWWFARKKDVTLQTFGLGLAGYTAGLAAWTLLVILKPEDLQPLVLAGAVPFLLAHFAFAKVAYKNIDFTKTSLLTLVVAGAIAATFAVRTFIYPSEPYFSSEGLLYFGLHPLSIALYIATMALTLLPAISVVADRFKNGTTRSVLQVGLTALFINAVILVSGGDDTLLLINGVAMSTALVALLLAAFSSGPKALASTASRRK